MPGEKSIATDWLRNVERLLVCPAEELAVQRPGALEVARVELVPHDRRVVRALAARTNRDHVTERIAERWKRCPILRVHCRSKRFATDGDQPGHHGFHIVDSEVTEPMGWRSSRTRSFVKRPRLEGGFSGHAIRKLEPDGVGIERAGRHRVRRPQRISTKHAARTSHGALGLTSVIQAGGKVAVARRVCR